MYMGLDHSYRSYLPSNKDCFSYLQGLVVLDRDKRRFSDIMEEKANKLGKSWKEPGKKIKLVSRLSQSDVKDVIQEGMVHVTIYIHSRAFNKVVALEKKSI